MAEAAWIGQAGNHKRATAPQPVGGGNNISNVYLQNMFGTGRTWRSLFPARGKPKTFNSYSNTQGGSFAWESETTTRTRGFAGIPIKRKWLWALTIHSLFLSCSYLLTGGPGPKHEIPAAKKQEAGKSDAICWGTNKITLKSILLTRLPLLKGYYEIYRRRIQTIFLSPLGLAG